MGCLVKFINVLDENVFQNPQILRSRTHGLFPEQTTLAFRSNSYLYYHETYLIQLFTDDFGRLRRFSDRSGIEIWDLLSTTIFV
jgi:hypothetical protein